MISFTRADGVHIMSVYCLKTKNSENINLILHTYVSCNNIYTRSSTRRLFTYSETAYIITSIFTKIIHKICQLWNTEAPGLHCYLFCDQLRAHMNDITRLIVMRIMFYCISLQILLTFYSLLIISVLQFLK